MTLLLVPLTGFMEEVGWRGFLQDTLERRHSPLLAALLVAASWGPWHIPTYLRLESEETATPILIALFLAGVVPLSVLLAWVHHRTGRRILPVIIAHAAIDASAGYFLGPVRTGELRPFTVCVAVLYVCAALVLWRDSADLRVVTIKVSEPFSAHDLVAGRCAHTAELAPSAARMTRAKADVVDLMPFVKIDRTPRTSVQAGLDELPRIVNGGSANRPELHRLLLSGPNSQCRVGDG